MEKISCSEGKANTRLRNRIIVFQPGLATDGAMDASQGHDHSGRYAVLRMVKRSARHIPTELWIEYLAQLGERPLEVMTNIAALRWRGVILRRPCDGGESKWPTEISLPYLLSELSKLERRQTEKHLKEVMAQTRTKGATLGHPPTMTPERQVIAARMLALGKRGREVLAVIRELQGPNISRAAYYIWQKGWVEKNASGKKCQNRF